MSPFQISIQQWGWLSDSLCYLITKGFNKKRALKSTVFISMPQLNSYTYCYL
ncbi:hypothetical protein A8V23_07710 [Yersinia pestis]|uniref:Uncharacterized protein n=1 Tax=Yersinia pestis TaxID=632 RepID=Q74WX2_YERPE|nr:hypothetical protein BAY22_14905 [Yersinia pestis]EDM41415.1 hypothetical protein YPE_0049 [Yersinia pestis CA88-4125]KJG85932.1 hypothetical protein RN23_07860 [Yersinia pestis subsp. microtus bv. Ulegeica]KKM53537.1 hypothetical protein KD37_01105 [Yersinia pestis subsp. pestis bv. Orientalis]KPD43745.1 hypothetical protein AC473_13615 [Yersinia pestis subsp. microtus bv. Caucasica]KPD51538.1 hypothetical protein AC596_17645 [Yersinia pestis subsp. microtus bv. Hissarica]KPD58975.1 hypot